MKPFLFLPMILLAEMATAQPILPLDSVLARVAKRNPEIRMWELKGESRRAAAEGAGAWMPPEIGIGGQELAYGSASDMTPGDPALMLTFRQMVPGPGKRGSRRSYLESLAERDRAEGHWMKSRLLAEARMEYARLSTSNRKLVVLAESEALMNLMLEVAEARYKLRRTDLASVLEARARLEELKSMRTMEKAMARQASSALALLMADPEGPAFTADTTLRPRKEIQGLDSATWARRGDLDQVEKEIHSMELNLEWMRRQGWPDFGLQFDHMEMGEMGRRYSAMAMVTLPLAPWSSGMVRSDVAAMGKDIQSMRADLEARRLMARGMAEEMRIMLEGEMGRLERVEREVIPAYRKSLDASLAAYQEGTGELFRVLDTWDRWVMARMQSLEHLRKVLALEAEYDREAGRL